MSAAASALTLFTNGLASRKFSPCQTTSELEDEDEFEDEYD
jgi:hypothetical protein